MYWLWPLKFQSHWSQLWRWCHLPWSCKEPWSSNSNPIKNFCFTFSIEIEDSSLSALGQASLEILPWLCWKINSFILLLKLGVCRGLRLEQQYVNVCVEQEPFLRSHAAGPGLSNVMQRPCAVLAAKWSPVACPCTGLRSVGPGMVERGGWGDGSDAWVSFRNLCCGLVWCNGWSVACRQASFSASLFSFGLTGLSAVWPCCWWPSTAGGGICCSFWPRARVSMMCVGSGDSWLIHGMMDGVK